MHTVELLDEACEVAESLGYKIRQEWLGGTGGGACEFSGQKWIFIDLALNAIEQLDQVAGGLRHDPGIYFASLSYPLQQLLGVHLDGPDRPRTSDQPPEQETPNRGTRRAETRNSHTPIRRVA